MRFSINDMLYAFSYALDCVEHDLIGVSSHHGLRVACLSVLLGKEMKLSETELLDLAACAVLHDNALTEYIQSEWNSGTNILEYRDQIKAAPHCSMGEKNMQLLPFYSRIEGAVLYHHENADGTGAFGKTEAETPLMAQLIHISDQVDATINLASLSDEKYGQLLYFVQTQKGAMFSAACTEAFEAACSKEKIELMSQDANVFLKSLLPRRFKHFTKEESISFSKLFSSIIDYKSKFTCIHSRGVAARCAAMGNFYRYSEDELSKLYFAGAVHDIGKLVIDRDILEKPDKLTNQEYIQIKNHAYYSYKILSEIEGFEEITGWASLHHEKLNGTGYPFGKTGSELNKNERLMGCIDIYQALTEERPYKHKFSHEKAISLMRQMADNGLIDGSLVNDLDNVFKNWTFFTS